MTVKELSKLYWLNREIEADKARLAELDQQIERDERRLLELEESATSVSALNYDDMPKSPSLGVSQVERAAIELADLRAYIADQKALRQAAADTIRAKQIMCLAERNRLETYIAGIPDTLIRLILTYRFINGLSWFQVSEHIGMRTTEDSVKKQCYRFLKEQNQDES